MATSLGLVGIVNKGDYSSSATYVKGNFVYYNHSTWLCIVPSATNITPSLQTSTTWQPLALGVNLEVFTGATASTDGTMGAVPQPHAGDEGKFLKGSGGWANVPDPQVFTGATASAGGTSGLVPAPSAGDEGKFIRGDGSWASAAADDNFVGTLAQWNALTLAEQIKYKTADITNDFNGSPIDSALSDTSINPVQNKVVKAAIDGINNKIAASYKNFIFGQYRQSAVSTVTITSSSAIKDDDVLYVCVMHSGGNRYSFGIMSRLYNVNLNISMLGNTDTACEMRRLTSTSFSITVSSPFTYYYVAIAAPETYTFTAST